MSFFFEATHAYTVDEELRSTAPRDPRGITLDTLRTNARLSKMERKIYVDGVCPDDLAVIAACVDTDAAIEIRYLMTSYAPRGRGVLVPGNQVLDSPHTHMTSELARKVSILPLEELTEFGIDSLAGYVKQRYPNIK